MGEEYVARIIVCGGIDGQGIRPLPVFFARRLFERDRTGLQLNPGGFLNQGARLRNNPHFFGQAVVLRLSRPARLAKGVKGRSGSWFDEGSFAPPPT
jgi:hypothetical protein